MIPYGRNRYYDWIVHVDTLFAVISSLSSPGLTGRSSNHRPGVLDCPVKPGNGRFGRKMLSPAELASSGPDHRRAASICFTDVRWAKAPGTANGIHEGGVRLCPRGRDARLGWTAWAKSRGAPRRHISRGRRFCPPYDERRYDANLENDVLGPVYIRYSGRDSR